MPSTSFFSNDLVALKEIPKIHALVDCTWRDGIAAFFPRKSDWILHKDIPKKIRSEYNREGRCPQGWAIVSFVYPYSGSSLVSEKSLLLIDRSLPVGDIVKRRLRDTVSGTVIGAFSWCNLRPVLDESSPNESRVGHPEANDNGLRRIPEAELRYIQEYEPFDIVAFHDWVGTIEEVIEEVVIRLENGSIIAVDDLKNIRLPRPVCAAASDKALPEILTQRRKLTFDKLAGSKENLRLGQLVVTNKAALTSAKWISGSYDPSASPRGTVIEINVVELVVDWIQPNPFSPKVKSCFDYPPKHLYGKDIKDVCVYDICVPSRESGSTRLPNLLPGDIARFRDPVGAALKYGSEDGQCGVFTPVPPLEPHDYDLNLFSLTSTETRLLVQWQDMSITEESSTDLIPYINLDDHDVWPGTIIAFLQKDTDLASEADLIHPERVGVVQWVDAAERLARVRWFAHPEVIAVNIPEPCLLPGSRLGELSPNETVESLYEITIVEALNKYRGDIVVVNVQHYVQQSGTVISRQSPPVDNSLVHDLAATHQDAHFSQTGDPTLPQSGDFDGLFKNEYYWIGHIVSQGLDGLITVRLGLLHEVQDIRVPVEAIVGTVKTKDDTGEDSEDELDECESSLDMMSEESFSDDPVDVIVEYEGGARLDTDSGESVWTTDDENNASSDETTNAQSPKPILPAKDPKSIMFKPSMIRYHDLRFNKFPNMPRQFELLDDPVPDDHHFSSSKPTLKATLLRRIRKEHSILENSLPEGIWVRAWAGNLTILRVLIVGPQGTPYSLAPFVIDFHFKADFPKTPPEAHFHSWTNGNRINPNLYEDGKVCLSLLGTWPGIEKNESWSDSSSVLQILVSLMGLVLVEEPFFNEPGFAALAGVSDAYTSSAMYTERAFVMARGFIVYALSHEIAGVDPIVQWLYCAKTDSPQLLRLIVEQCDTLLADKGVAVEGNDEEARLSSGAKLLLQKHIDAMRPLLAKIN